MATRLVLVSGLLLLVVAFVVVTGRLDAPAPTSAPPAPVAPPPSVTPATPPPATTTLPPSVAPPPADERSAATPKRAPREPSGGQVDAERRTVEGAERRSADARRRLEDEARAARARQEAESRQRSHERAQQAARAAPVTLPEFPWPPPAPSARTELARTMFVATGTPDPMLASIAKALVNALEQAKYSEYSFYRAPGGFALVARLERMADDGAPMPDRFRFLDPSAKEPFAIATYVKQLFFAPEGFYRQIVFVTSDQPFTATGPKIDAKGAARLLSGGANRLTGEFETTPFTARHGVSALIYELRKGPREGDVTMLDPGRLTARTHLERAGLLSALAAR